ncbi:MAG: 4Fe-4S dicluster domain-containing protein [Candidatus Taylorbacteria bacterium]|nr:4Fe-4S dicluster domain-containing protein [Candidatus Taylorbacteria bacterium]
MAYVIAEPCVDVLDQTCVTVCPVACIHFDDNDRKLYIDPNECIDCNACTAVCPESAIYFEFELPTKWEVYAKIDSLWFQNKNAARKMIDKQIPIQNTS